MDYTRGPLVVRSKGSQEWAIDAPNGDATIGHEKWSELATVYGSDDFPIRGAIVGRANARLFAAAGELYEALKEMNSLWMQNVEWHEWEPIVKRAMNVMAKVEGKD